jgi:iron complex outermembrane receptor protein
MKIKLLLSALLCSLLNASADDVNNLLNLSLEELLAVQFNEVSRKEQSAMDSTSATYTLTGEQIKRSGATNIPEALRLVPGVHVGRISGSQYAVSIRSANTLLSDQLLVMIDGREVFNRLFNGTYWDSIDTMIEDIDRIEVIRGPGGSLWGSNAGNGIINIVTKKATKTLNTLIAVEIGSGQDHGRLSGRVGFGDEKSASRLYATSKDIDQSTSAVSGKTSYDALGFQ